MKVVKTYDYYTLEQAKKVIRQEIIEDIKMGLGLSAMTIIPILVMFLAWLKFGY